MLNKKDRDDLLATVAMDMFCTGNSIKDEIEFYQMLEDDGNHAQPDTVMTLESNRPLLLHIEKHFEEIFDVVVAKIQEMERHLC